MFVRTDIPIFNEGGGAFTDFLTGEPRYPKTGSQAGKDCLDFMAYQPL